LRYLPRQQHSIISIGFYKSRKKRVTNKLTFLNPNNEIETVGNNS
jgi:hypothetical protein